MGFFSRSKGQPEVAQHEVQFSADAIIVSSSSQELVTGLIEFWEAMHGDQPAEPKKAKTGFSTDHMSDLESEVDHAGTDEVDIIEDGDDEED